MVKEKSFIDIVGILIDDVVQCPQSLDQDLNAPLPCHLVTHVELAHRWFKYCHELLERLLVHQQDLQHILVPALHLDLHRDVTHCAQSVQENVMFARILEHALEAQYRLIHSLGCAQIIWHFKCGLSLSLMAYASTTGQS